jgi:hypothetical protein
MLRVPVIAIAGAAMIVATAVAPATVGAQPVHLVPSLDSMSGTAHVEEVQFRHRGGGGPHHRWHRHRDRDAWFALGVSSAIAGGIIASQSYGYGAPYYDGSYGYSAPVYGGPAYASASTGWERCQAEFRSLRADGTYTTYGGEQKPCPYLR